jgi:hypothetical protein
MPGYFIQVPGGVVSTEAYYQTMPKPCQEDTVIWDRRWCYQRRSPDTVPQWDQTFVSTGAWWPMLKSGAFNDPADPYTFMEGDYPGIGSGQYAGWEYGLGGSQSRKFIMGQCKQVSGDPFGGAEVQAYRTSDDLYAGNGYADDKGRYEVGVPNTPNDAHYLVAYSAGIPAYAGTTVNTIVPTWRDGTT